MGKGPDPSEFDPEFVIGDDEDQPSRTATPRPKEKEEAAEEISTTAKEKDEASQATAVEEKAVPPPDIPPEVKTRLRKLDKLEPKYSGRHSLYHIMMHPN